MCAAAPAAAGRIPLAGETREEGECAQGVMGCQTAERRRVRTASICASAVSKHRRRRRDRDTHKNNYYAAAVDGRLPGRREFPARNRGCHAGQWQCFVT